MPALLLLMCIFTVGDTLVNQYQSWRQLLAPCQNDRQWHHRTTRQPLTKLFYFHVSVARVGGLSTIHVRSLSRDGRQLVNRTTGGDYYWVRVTGTTSFLVPLHDANDGNYTGRFSVPVEGFYRLHITLEYRNCDGLKDPPQDWFKNASSQGFGQRREWLGNSSARPVLKSFSIPFIVQKKCSSQTHQAISKKNESCLINPERGFWKQGSYITPMNLLPIKLPSPKNTLPTLWMYGDSVMIRFYKAMKNSLACRIYFNCKYTYNWVYPLKNNKEIPTKEWNFDYNEFNKTRHLTHIRDALTHQDMRRSGSVFFVNFGIHLLRTIKLDDAMSLFDDFLQMIKHLGSPKVIWRTTTPTNILGWGEKTIAVGRRFVTKQRTDVWNSYTLEKLCKVKIPTLDVHWPTASSTQFPRDGVHYDPSVFQGAASVFNQYLLQNY